MIATSLAAALGAATATLAAAPVQAAGSPVLRDSVTCIYDAVTPEQREIVQTLLLQNLEANGSPFSGDANMKEVQATLKDAMNACVDKYSWSSGKTEGGMKYAMFTMLSEAITPILIKDGVIVADIDAYVAAHKAGWRQYGPPTKAMTAEFTAYLTQKGWKMDDQRIAAGARLYFNLQLARDASRRFFAQFVTYRH